MTPDHRPFSLRPRRQDGFTLIELLVVIVILGVLAAIVVFSVRGIGDKGRKNAVAADAAALRTAEESYCAQHGRYGTIDELKAAGLLTGEPVYNMVAVGAEDKCGRGENSSYTLYDTAPLVRAPDPVQVGAKPSDLAVDEKADRVYVVAADSNDVTVIDGKTDTPVGAPISLSGTTVAKAARIAVHPGTGRVYVGGEGGVAVIDTANGNTVTQVSGFSTTVSALAVSPENGDVYVGGGPVEASVVAYIPAGTASATTIPLPAPGIASAAGLDFTFDPARHEVYLAKAGVGSGTTLAAGIGLFAISSQTHEARVVWWSPTKPACSNNAGNVLIAGSVRGAAAVDPNRHLVYLLAQKCVPDTTKPGAWKAVATTIAVDPANNTATPIDDPVGTLFTPVAAVYNPAAGSVYVYARGGQGTNCGGSGARIGRIVGTAPKQQGSVCAVSNSAGNAAHKVAVLRNLSRVFVAQLMTSDATGRVFAPGGLGVADGTTLLPQPTLGAPVHFGALAVNNTTAKVYALDPASGKLTVFRTGSA
ncbi:prepilin-type N-terminal cleavage/methylation domain-containing protein [Streptomyces sp. NPDC090077]|uniref:prepilin-type N-terminal cleavage/methylation domain-containing protein n=1 Tax=Streptomyces sp. NPDC090077 TaxID=3365938 RepID=UPI00381BEB41